jgi:hypothetical protein
VISCGVFGFIDVLEQPIGEPQSDPVLRLEEIRKGCAVAGRSQAHEFRVCLLKQHPLDYHLQSIGRN